MTQTRTPIHHHVRKVFRKTHDPLWQMQLAVILVIALQVFTSNSFLPFPKLWLVSFEVLLLLGLIFVTAEGYKNTSRTRRNIAISLIGVITAINIFSLILLIGALVVGHSDITGSELLRNGLVIYLTNILLLALWYWEMDGHGPERRVVGQAKRDFLFPQMVHTRYGENWLPGFADYLYLSTTNVTNFASADTLPLSHRAKMLMMVQSLMSVAIVLLVLAHAVSVLG